MAACEHARRCAAIGTLEDQHPAAVFFDDVAQTFRIDALPVEQVGLGGPALAARVAAIGRSDQCNERGYVGHNGVTDCDGGGLI